MDIFFLIGSLVKIVAVLAFVYGLLWVLGLKTWWLKGIGLVGLFGVVQLGLTDFGGFQLMNSFDLGLLFQAISMAMVALGLNLIYGFNGQFSLGQWGFYGLGAYCAADITFRWVNGDARGLIVVGVGVLLGAVVMVGVNKMLNRIRGVPVLSQFTIYIIAVVLVGAVAVLVGRLLNPLLSPLLGTLSAPGPLNSAIAQYIIFFLSVIFAGIFAAEISYLFGLPVLTLGSDYFGIATLGFTCRSLK
jgi:branched-chain amino acid transport system permease protein